jgi:hypothetical protein
MTLLSERRITIEKLLISEGFAVSAVLNYRAGPNADPVVVAGGDAYGLHAEIPKERKVKPPTNAVGGFTDPLLPTFNLRFDKNKVDGLIGGQSKEMTGVDTNFPIWSVYTTVEPDEESPPCVEMLLNAIKQKNQNTPYRISDETLAAYEQAAAESMADYAARVGGKNNPIFIIVPCPSSSTHTKNLANALQQRLADGLMSARERNMVIRRPEQAFTLDILKKVTYGEAAERIKAARDADAATGAAILNSDRAIETAAENVTIARNDLATLKNDREAAKAALDGNKRHVQRRAADQIEALYANRALELRYPSYKEYVAARDRMKAEILAGKDSVLAYMDRQEAEARAAYPTAVRAAEERIRQAEAAMAGPNEQRAAQRLGHVVFNPDLDTRVRHNALHAIWNDIGAMPYDVFDYFQKLKPTKYWLIMAAKSAVAAGNELLAAKWRNRIKFALDFYAAKIPAPLTVDLVLEGLCDAGNINENNLDANGPDGDEARGFLADLMLDTPQMPNAAAIARKAQLIDLFSAVCTTAVSCKELKDAIKTIWNGSAFKGEDFGIASKFVVGNAAREWDKARSGSSTSSITNDVMISTYSVPFNEWVAGNQAAMNTSIINNAAATPGSGFSVSKVSAQSGNRKHTEGYIVANEAHNDQAVFNEVQGENLDNQRPYILVVVDDNVETGTSMREAAKAAIAKFRTELGANFAAVIGVTALAIRGPTVRCSSITPIPYTI